MFGTNKRTEVSVTWVLLFIATFGSWGWGFWVFPGQPPVVSQTQNLIHNSSFEGQNGLSGWEILPKGSNVFQSKVEHAPGAGSASACSVQSGQNNSEWTGIGIPFTARLNVTPDHQYSFTALLKTEGIKAPGVLANAKAARPHLRLTFFDKQGQKLPQSQQPSATYPNTSSEWVPAKVEDSAPSTAATAYLVIVHGLDENDKPVPTSVMCVDDVRFEDMTSETE